MSLNTHESSKRYVQNKYTGDHMATHQCTCINGLHMSRFRKGQFFITFNLSSSKHQCLNNYCKVDFYTVTYL